MVHSMDEMTAERSVSSLAVQMDMRLVEMKEYDSVYLKALKTVTYLVASRVDLWVSMTGQMMVYYSDLMMVDMKAVVTVSLMVDSSGGKVARSMVLTLAGLMDECLA